MYQKALIFVLFLLQLCQGAIERDLLLTPKEEVHSFGRTLFYNPHSNDTKNRLLPWEQSLKHVTFLTLFTEAARGSNASDVEQYNKFMQSPYVRIHEDYPRFGDIITLARGRLEKPKEYRFVEGICEQSCEEKVLALWRVQKIRHRDSQRGFRYEMKFSVTPLDGDNVEAMSNKHTLDEQYFKSYIMKDDDYPESFNALTRRSDSGENFSGERQARIINEIPSMNQLPSLNIGEYFKQVPRASSKVGYLGNTRPDYPTTYRPNYRVKFTKPVEFKQPEPEEPKTVVTHHFHHHYFMKDTETALHDDQHLFPDALRVIEGPQTELLSPKYLVQVQSTTTPSPALFYMQQIPLYIESFPREELPTNQEEDVKQPFKHSEQQFEEIRYSDPDPLYENVDTNSDGSRSFSESASAEIHPQVERPGVQISPRKYSINAQLPAPAVHEDTEIPYVDDVEKESTTQEPKATMLTRKTLLPKNKYFISTSTSESPIKHASKFSLHKNRNFPSRTTSEQPVLKWMPKRKPKEQQTSSERSTASSTEKVVIVTPSKVDATEFEILTQKSVSKSVSVKVGNRTEEEIPLGLETGTTISSEIQDSESESEDTSA